MNKLTILYSLLLLLLGATIWLFFNLDIGEEPIAADIIIVNEGMGPERANKGVELMLAGYADQIIVSPPAIERGEFSLLPWYYEAGAEEDDLVLETEATSTWTNAVYSIELMEENGWQSALVVSSDYHMRRVRLSYERAAKDKDLSFTYVSAYAEEDGEEVSYLQSGNSFGMAISELWKYPGYLLGLYHFIDL